MTFESFSYHRPSIYAAAVILIAILSPTPDPAVIVGGVMVIIAAVEICFRALRTAARGRR